MNEKPKCLVQQEKTAKAQGAIYLYLNANETQHPICSATGKD